MRVAVTGGSGKLGRYVVKDLKDSGHEVLNLDRKRPEEWVSRFVELDLTSLGQVYDALASFQPEGLIHLAANPMPWGFPRHQQFMDNVGSAHAVFLAAADLGVKRLVYASSEQVTGWSSAGICPPCLPFAEGDGIAPKSSYALSKKIGEEIAEAMASRATEMPIVSLRINYVMGRDEYEALRTGRPNGERYSPNLWCYIDARDAAEAFRLALEAETEGHRAYMVAADDTFLAVPTREAVLRHFPSVKFSPTLAEFGSAVDSSRIRDELGWRPKFNCRDLFA